MAHHFYEDEPELQPQASGNRAGGPPRKLTGVDLAENLPSAQRPQGLMERVRAAVAKLLELRRKPRRKSKA